MEDDRRLVGSLHHGRKLARRDQGSDGRWRWRLGATRLVYMLDGSAQWNEQIVEYDATGMSWTYIATSDLPVPFNVFNKDTFRCTMSVKELSADKCEIMIGCVSACTTS